MRVPALDTDVQGLTKDVIGGFQKNGLSNFASAIAFRIVLALIPFLRPVLEGRSAWAANETLSRAIEIWDGRVMNPAILAFQGRSADHPHPVA